MYEISKETLRNAYKPFDIVTCKDGSVGFIQEVSVNDGQPEGCQISYAVNWMVGTQNKHAWFNHEDLIKHCNLFVKIAESSCHPFGSSGNSVKKLMNTGIS